MGLYPMDCPQCGKGHLWFSGNLDQRCGDCQGALTTPFKEKQYKVTAILPPPVKEEPEELIDVNLSRAMALRDKYGLLHLSVNEVAKIWEDYSDTYCAGWLIDDKASVEYAFGVTLEEI
jgi:hypothetical protein